MNPDLKANLKAVPKNYSTWAAVAIAALGYIGSTGAESFQDLVTNFSPAKLAGFVAALALYVVARVAPQGSATPAPEPVQPPAAYEPSDPLLGDTRPMDKP